MAVTGKVPGVLVIHDWTGVQPYSTGRADQLAALGYVAMVADIDREDIRERAFRHFIRA